MTKILQAEKYPDLKRPLPDIWIDSEDNEWPNEITWITGLSDLMPMICMALGAGFNV
jgi:hypothetical protein